MPDFIQAHFAEAPRFDNLSIRPGFVEPGCFWRRWISRVKRLFDGDRDVPARWRALKRLAIQGHDHEREQLFFPMEIRSARFVTDWPLPLARPAWEPPQDAKEARRPWWARLPVVPRRPAAWQGFFRFWFGVAYGLLSSYGRSVVLPALWWLALIAVSAAIYLGESEIADGKRTAPFAARAGQVIAYAPPVSLVATPPAPTPCATVSGDKLRSLEPRLAARTDAVAEALQLAAANGSVLGGLGGPESARRTYGCLFGFVSDAGGNLAPIVPAFVSTWSLIQKTLSLILIFLLGLAVRNMLKMK